MPDWVKFVRERLSVPDLKVSHARDIVEELASQLEDVYRTARGRGASEEEAEAETRGHILDWDKLAADIRDAAPSLRQAPVSRAADAADERARSRGRAGIWLADLGLDIRYALRTLRRQPAFTTVVVLLIGLGVGANTAVFSVLKAVFLQPLDYPEPGELAILWETSTSGGRGPVSWPNYLDWRTENLSFEHMGSVQELGMTLTDGEVPELVWGAFATASAIDVFGVQPAMGRWIRQEEDGSDVPIVVLGHEIWATHFESDPGIIGRVIHLDGIARTIVGVMPDGFTIPSPWNANQADQWWTPFPPSVRQWGRDSHSYPVYARLRDGVSWEEAAADMERVALNLAAAYPETNATQRVWVRPLHRELFGPVGGQLMVLLIAASLVLLIACGNVASLLLSRATVRRTEIAVRTAMGAGRERVVRMLLTEGGLLAVAGGALALLLTTWGIGILRGSLPASIPRASDIRIDGTVPLFALAVSALTAVIFGLAPAVSATRGNQAESLREGGGRAGRRTHLRNVFVIGQLGLTLMLVHATALLVGSYLLLRDTEFGFETDNILTVALVMPPATYPAAGDREAFLTELVERLDGLPGVTRAAAVNRLPFEGGTNARVIVEGREIPPDPNQRPLVERKVMVGDYLGAAGISLRAGRIIESADSASATSGAIINERMAERLWPGENPLGKRFSFSADPPEWLTVVGVAANVPQWNAERPAISEAYRPYSLMAQGRMFVVLKTVAEPIGLVDVVRQEVLALNPNMPVTEIRTMDQLLNSQFSQRELMTGIFGLFAVLAIVLGVAGVYGVVAFFVAQRTREIGVRIALGAPRGRLVGLVLGRGLRLAVAGVICGTVGSFATARVIGNLVYGFRATDWRFTVGVSVLLLGVAATATLVPARRATKVDPARALQAE